MPIKHDVLLLFDLDGVILNSGGIPERFPYAIRKIFGVNTKTIEEYTHGKTEPEVLVEIGTRYGITPEDLKSHIQELFDAVTEYCRNNWKASSLKVLDGAQALLAELKKQGYVTCTATGNNTEMTKLKLEKAGLFKLFDILGSSKGPDDRITILTRTIKEAEAEFGRKFTSILYFGDSPTDIKAARECGIKIVSVASGKFSLEELKALRPDYALENLLDMKKVIEVINDCETKDGVRGAVL